jgi:hypothetical protein
MKVGSLFFTLIAALATTFLVAANPTASCHVSPNFGAMMDASTASKKVSSIFEKIGAPFLWVPLADIIIGGIIKYETPIQTRLAVYHGMNVYNAIAMYHSSALDIWGRSDHRICVDEFGSDEELRVHEHLTSVYAFAYSTISLMPELTTSISSTMETSLGLRMDLILDSDKNNDLRTPWGLAKAFVDEMTEFIENDGWNANGVLANEFNKMPYSDFDFKDILDNEYSRYETATNEKMNIFEDGFDKNKCKNIPDPLYWEPLLESNAMGYFVRQEHVTPHAGFTGRLYGLTTEEYASFSSPLPDHDYCFESEFVLDNTNELATSDRLKMEVELFDSKFTSLLPMLISWSFQSRVSQFDFWYNDMVSVTSFYAVTMLAWRDKVLFNLIRPTTIVHAIEGENYVTTYAGPFEGSKTIQGKDWHPYIRTMPHAEYPSGSSCICTAFAEVLQIVTGKDDTEIPVVQHFPAGSSKLEPGVTPSQNLTFTYTKWSQIQQACGSSREAGGMHFSQAVSGGEVLCSGVAALVLERADLLKNGDAAGAMADFEDRDIYIKTKKYDSKKKESKKKEFKRKKSKKNSS